MLALIICLILVLSFGKRQLRVAIAYALAFTSHGILDYATAREGGGVELLWPFSSQRFVLGWVGLSEVPSKLPAMEVVKSLGVELMFFAPLLIVVLGLRKYLGKDTRISDSAF